MPWLFRRRYVLTENNPYYDKLKKLYLDKKEKDKNKLSRTPHIQLSAWFKDRRKNEGIDCVPDIDEIKRRTFSDIICAKDYVAGMTDNYAEERYRGDVDCHCSKLAWERQGMDKLAYFGTETIIRK